MLEKPSGIDTKSIMPKKVNQFHIRAKVWIEDDNSRVVFGLGRARILETIQQVGSITAAAKELKMSYRAVWGKIKTTEECLGQPLLIRNVGGALGGGSQLTTFAKTILKQFRQLHRSVRKQSDKTFEKGRWEGTVERYKADTKF